MLSRDTLDKLATPALLGMAFMLLNTVSMTTMHAVIRLVPGDLPTVEIAFFRNLFGLGMLLPWQLYRGGLGAFHTTRLRLHLARGVVNVAAMLAFFHGVTITPLAQVSALSFTAPLFASVMAFVFLKERGRSHRILVTGVGFVGALILLRPGVEAVGLGPLLILASAAAWSVAMVFIKMLSRTDTSATIALYMVLVMAPISLLAALPVWVTPDWHQLAWLVVMAVLGTAGQLALGQAFRLADATAVMPLDFTRLIWSTVLGYLLFMEIPDVWTLVGGTVIFASATTLALRESR